MCVCKPVVSVFELLCQSQCCCGLVSHMYMCRFVSLSRLSDCHSLCLVDSVVDFNMLVYICAIPSKMKT